MVEKVSIPLDEQETTIGFYPSAMDKMASWYSSDPVIIRRMWKLYEEHPDEVELVNDDKYGCEFRVPREWIKVRPKREVSEEQRQAAAERLAKARENKQ